jgi:hypothetical protein
MLIRVGNMNETASNERFPTTFEVKVNKLLASTV